VVAVTDQHSADQHPADQHPAHSAYQVGLDPDREPSADWGFPVAGPLAGWFTAVALFAMLIGNHRSHVENVFLISLGALLVVALIAHHLKARKAKQH
jgi:hypothetical protein